MRRADTTKLITVRIEITRVIIIVTTRLKAAPGLLSKLIKIAIICWSNSKIEPSGILGPPGKTGISVICLEVAVPLALKIKSK